MSYFLEDTVSSYDIINDYTGINECMFNAEIAWSNIMENAMKNEYQAIKNEDSVALREGISDVFETIKDWFKKMIQSITRVLANIKNKILLKTNYYGRWAYSMAKKIPKLVTKDKIEKLEKANKKVLHTDQLIGISTKDGIKEFINEYSGIESDANAIKDKSDYNDAMETMNKNYRTAQEELARVKTTFKEKSIKTAWTDAASIKKTLDNIKNTSKAVEGAMKGFQSAIKVCKIGIKYADKEDKDSAIANKWKAQYINQYSSRYLNLKMAILNLEKKNVSNVIKPLVNTGKDKDFDTKYDKASKRIVDSYYGF